MDLEKTVKRLETGIYARRLELQDSLRSFAQGRRDLKSRAHTSDAFFATHRALLHFSFLYRL